MEQRQPNGLNVKTSLAAIVVLEAAIAKARDYVAPEDLAACLRHQINITPGTAEHQEYLKHLPPELNIVPGTPAYRVWLKGLQS